MSFLLSFVPLFLPALSIKQLPWSWDHVQLWTDFYVRDNIQPLLLPNVSSFLATNYQIISVEKCLGYHSSYSTEQYFLEISSQLRQYNNNNDELKILFYFNTNIAYCDCYYNLTSVPCNNESYWLQDSDGNVIWSVTNKRPYLDMSKSFVQEWWVDAVANMMQMGKESGINVNGVMADGVCPYLLGKDITTSKNDEILNGINNALLLCQNVFSKMSSYDNEYLVIGNGLKGYSYPSDNCRSGLNVSDGLMIEHYGGFEQLDKTNGNWKQEFIKDWYNIVYLNKRYYNKLILVKAWIGPPESPSVHLDYSGYAASAVGYSWPDGFEYTTPKNYSRLQKLANGLLQFPLAVYLCALVREYVYFSFGYWYDVHSGYYPCPDNYCAAPSQWFNQFASYLGEPTSEPKWTHDGLVCQRQFENVNVTVNISDVWSANIIWNTSQTLKSL